MGMFPVQNYGRDFNEAFVGMGNFLTGQRKADSDLKQRDLENSRADATLAMQKEASRATVDHTTAQTEKAKRENENQLLLQAVTPVYGKVLAGEDPTDDDINILGKMRVKLPYLTNNLDDNKKLQEAHTILIEANEKAKTLPPSDTPYKFERGDSPELDKVLDSWNMVTSPARHKTHVDQDGSVTGTKGAEYSTDQIQAGAGISTPGGAKTAAYFSIVDANGAPIYQTDAAGNTIFKTDQEGKPLLDDTGQPVPQRKLVAASIGQTNDQNSRIDFVPADALIMKSRLALEQLQTENKLTPEQRDRLKKEIEVNMHALTPGGVEKMLAAQVKDNKPLVVHKDTDVIDPQTGKPIYSNKSPVKPEYKSRNRQEGTKEVFEESQDGGKTWNRVSDGPKFNPRPDPNGVSLDKRDISVRLREAQRGYQAAMKTGDPDAITESIGFIESLNEDAKKFGVTPMPVPVRPFSSTENEAIKAQAVKNLEEKRGRAAKVFGVKPSVPAINQEIRRLKQTVKPGSVSFEEPPPPTQATQTATMRTLPPAGQHKGRLIQDDGTGKKYRSNGAQWVEER